MKTLLRIAPITALLFLLASCYPSKELMKSEGDTATIETNNNTTYTGEFLFVKDTALFVILGDEAKKSTMTNSQRICSIPLTTVKSVQIEGYANRKWVGSMLLFQVIPTVVFGIEVAAHSERVDWGSFILVLGTPTLLTYLLLESSTPLPPLIKTPFAGMDEFAKYARFPKGLDDTQLNDLLKSYGQADVKPLN